MTTVADLRARLADTQRTLEAARAAVNPERNPGCSKLRGKQHGIRIDSSIRRTAEAFAEVERLEREVRSLDALIECAERKPVDPETLAGAKFVQSRRGDWLEVVRVNRTSVTVKTGYSWTDRIPHERIFAVSYDGKEVTK